jgi:hypothetical protein
VEESPDRWAPPVCDLEARDPLVGGRREGRKALALGCCAVGRKLGRGPLGPERRRRRGKKFWAFGPISRERKEKNKSLFLFIQNLFQI